MTLTEIMKDKERLYNGKPFRRKGRSFCIKWDEQYGFVRINSCKECDDELHRYSFIPEDFLADDWEWVEEWYEGDLKKKYPNGVLCRASSRETGSYIVVIKDYDEVHKRFVDTTGWDWEYAELVKREEAPAIIG